MDDAWTIAYKTVVAQKIAARIETCGNDGDRDGFNALLALSEDLGLDAQVDAYLLLEEDD